MLKFFYKNVEEFKNKINVCTEQFLLDSQSKIHYV